MSKAIDSVDDLEQLDTELSIEEVHELVHQGVIEAEDWAEFADNGQRLVNAARNVQEEAPGEDVSDEMIAESVDRADSWLTYNKGLENTGYLPAERITPDNVDELEVEYDIESDTPGLQNQPIVVPGDPPVMYVADNADEVSAHNARTGEEYWSYNPGTEREDSWALGHTNRGVGVWEDKIYLGTGDGFVVALDRYSGEELWREDLLWDEDLPEGYEEYPQVTTAMTAAVTVYDGIVFAGATTDQVNWAATHAIDAESGEHLWRDPLVPHDGWIEDTWAYGNSCAWMNPVVDPQTETVLFNTADPSSFYNSVHRPGPNKDSVSIIAYDFDGNRKWSNQLIAHEVWDYDCCSTPTVTDAVVGGQERRVVIEDAKDGWTHVIDIETGRYLQRSEPFAHQAHKFGGWPEREYLNLIPFDEEDAGGMHPSLIGGSHMWPDAYSPRTNYRYVGNHDSGGNEIVAEGYFPDEVEYGADDNPFTMGEVIGHDGTEPEAQVVAIDMDTGEEAWRYDLVGPDDFQSSNGGPTATAGGVVFANARNGKVVALDDETGDELWTDELGDSMSASPIAWDDPEAGKQYVEFTASDRYVVYALEAEVEEDDDNGDDGGADDGGADDGGADDGGAGGGSDDGGADDGADDAGDDDDGIPGFGVLAALGGVGAGAGAAVANRLRGSEEAAEEEREE